MNMEPALELTACAKEIPQTTFMDLAISVLAVRKKLYCNFSLRYGRERCAFLPLPGYFRRIFVPLLPLLLLDLLLVISALLAVHA